MTTHADKLAALQEKLDDAEAKLQVAERLATIFFRQLREQDVPGWGSDDGYTAMYGPLVQGIRDRRGW